MKADIRWVSFEDGGRRALPVGEGEPPYAAVIRFKDDKGPWPPQIAWTLVVRKHADLGENLWSADVLFRSQNAPHDALISGREFELFEGSKRVADGVIT